MRGFLAALMTAMLVALPGLAQDAETLAGIRADLQKLQAEIQGLRSEAQSGGSGITITGDLLQRIDLLESELARVTAQAEALGNRIDRVVADGTARIGDLNFRLTELEGGDLGDLGQTQPLGGAEIAAAPAAPATSQPEATDTGGVELAISERADFDRANEALTSGAYQIAAQQFAAFNQSYPGGPLATEADFLRGEALRQTGDWNGAARAYLDSFTAAPEADRAPDALYQLGLALNQLGQRSEACLMLREIGLRFAGSAQEGQAASQMQTLGCS